MGRWTHTRDCAMHSRQEATHQHEEGVVLSVRHVHVVGRLVQPVLDVAQVLFVHLDGLGQDAVPLTSAHGHARLPSAPWNIPYGHLIESSIRNGARDVPSPLRS